MDHDTQHRETLLATYHRAVARHEGQADFWEKLGQGLQALQCEAEAITSFKHAIRLQPDLARLYSHLGSIYYQQGQLNTLLTLYEQALRYHPEHLQIHLNRAIALLTLGDFEAGWAAYEWRLKSPAYAEEMIGKTLWQGKALPGKTLCVLTEQGFGDALQFARYLPFMAQQSQAKLVIACPKTLHPVLQPAYPTMTWTTDIPIAEAYVYLNSLPFCLKRRQPETMAAPYIKPPFVQKTLNLPTHSLNVGLVWSGNPSYWSNESRRCPFTVLAALLELSNIQFYSLQMGDAAYEAIADARLTDLTTEIHDFGDTATIISQLHLLITVDTAIAHLAGALGCPTWLLLAAVPDWRWGLTGVTTPWYPTMRLFRQPTPGDWETVIAEVKQGLKKW